MGWQPLTTIQLTKDWQFSEITNADYYRFKLAVPQTNVEPLKLELAQSFFNSNQVDFLNNQLLYFSNGNYQIASLIKPYSLLNRRIAVKRDSKFYASPPWFLSIDYFDYSDSRENLADYLVNRFQDIIPLLGNAMAKKYQLIATAYTPAITRNVTSIILPSNPDREQVSIFNPDTKAITIGLNIQGNNLQNRLLSVAGGSSAILPLSINNNTYIGDIYGLPDFTGTIQITEFTKGDVINGTS